MATANVEFYEKLKHLQEQKRESERRRLLLEQQLCINTTSENKVHALRVAQLQNYWKKLCEDEKRSQRRNEQLLRDLDRITEHAARFAERTEKLRTLKCDYEAYIEKTYPNWKERVMSRHQQRMCAISNEQQTYAGPQRAHNEQPVHFVDGSNYHQLISNGRLDEFVQPIPGASGLIQQPLPNGIQYPGTLVFIPQQSGQKQATTLYPGPFGPVLSAADNERKVSIHVESPSIGHDARDLADRRRSESIQYDTDKRRASAADDLRKVSKESPAIADRLRSESIPHDAEKRRTSATDNQRKVSMEGAAIGRDARDLADRRRSESIQYDTEKRRTSAADNQKKDSVVSLANAAKDPSSSNGTSKDPNIIPTRELPSKDPIADPAKSLTSKDQALNDPTASPVKDPSSNNSARSSSKNPASDSPIKQLDHSLSPISSPKKRNSAEPLISKEANDVMASPRYKKTDGAKVVEQKEEIQTDRTYATEISDFEEDVHHNFNLSNSADAIVMRHQGKSVSVPAPDVSLQGFCRMLKAVEDDVSLGRSPKFYFRSATPRTSVVQEIITNANRGSPLSHFNVESIAMVILEQLPCISMNLKNSCLLTDQILTSCSGEVSNKVVRKRFDSSDHLFWDSLYNHFLIFLQHKVLSVTEIAEIFAPLLISGNSKRQKQAVVLVTKILEAISEEELNIATPRSTSDFSLASPRPPRDGRGISQPALQSVKSSTTAFDQKPKVMAAPSSASPLHHSTPLIPGLPLGSSLDEEGLSLSREPLATLTQTAAYKQLLASTNVSHKLPGLDSDEDDEIEKNLSQQLSSSRPIATNKASEENIKSPKSPENLKSPKSPKSDSTRSNFSDESLKQEIDRKNSLVLKSASLKSGRSAVENIISRVNDDFDLDDDDDDPPIPISSLKKANTAPVKQAKNDDDDDFWA